MNYKSEKRTKGDKRRSKEIKNEREGGRERRERGRKEIVHGVPARTIHILRALFLLCAPN
jgi:hypothetical protein